ncbi:DVU_1551 family NTP transferase [Desulfatitalea alkaliphila]|uniref:NTP transferase domain-containing protein n=1 Tax=Desulfatitalea alkaliphila TaxID=2929485 RepID=A0AA41UJI9_9BACT|nr:NTP transferase domain-containing protein [Desulfatitalea alkaliphila]MCJ8499426.1 NTP transferase domain-containing protein [Desulfatitalea alkaliphila]
MDGVSAIILAAGESRRMGRFKPLLHLGATTVVERVVQLYAAAGLKDIIVVTGCNSDALCTALTHLPLRCIHNGQWRAGMYTSLQAGLGALPVDARAFFVHPVDIPLVRPSTVGALARSFHDQRGAVCHPCYDGRRGHPVLIPAALGADLLAWPGEGGLRAFWQSWTGPWREVAVADEGILLDLDTPADLRMLTQRLERDDRPSADACRVLMTRVEQVPPAVWRHCRAVAAVAGAIADALQAAGVDLDADLVRSAALVHDIARQAPHHAAAGARLLADLGYPRPAAMVAVHMDPPVADAATPDEAAVLFLADKLVVGDRPADLHTRFERKMAKYGNDPRIAKAIASRRQAAEALLATVERCIGRPVAALTADLPLKGEQPG